MDKSSRTILITAVIMAIIAVTICAAIIAASIQNSHTKHQQTKLDSSSYIVYRGVALNYTMLSDSSAVEQKSGIMPIYIPVKDSIFAVGDTINTDASGNYNPRAMFKAVLLKKKGIVRLPLEASAD